MSFTYYYTHFTIIIVFLLYKKTLSSLDYLKLYFYYLFSWKWRSESERFEVGSLYVRRKQMVTEFLMVLSITNFGILCLFFYIITNSVSSVELQDVYILEPIYRIKDMSQPLSSSQPSWPCLLEYDEIQ